MLLQHETRKVHSSGLKKVIKFNIKANRQSFENLSSGIYSNQIRAILRELGTNAFDAHEMAGNKDPFEVWLPTPINPTLIIRDYGVGLSPEQMEDIYTSYFLSDKTENNDVDGCLGLGSKSPLAYTDTFSVTSFYNGMKYDYFVFFNEDGEPCLGLVSEEKTDEPNGLKIGLIVKKEDCQRFHDEAQSVYKVFSILPKIYGGNIDLSMEYIAKCHHFYLTKGKNQVYALMGNVAYPIDRNSYSTYGIVSSIWPYGNYDVYLKFKRAEISFVTSREKLQYNDKTSKAISEKVKLVQEEYSEHVSQKLKDCKTFWEASKVCNDYTVFRHSNNIKFTYKDKKVDTTIIIPRDNSNSCEVPAISYSANYYDPYIRNINPNRDPVWIKVDIANGFKKYSEEYYVDLINSGKKAIIYLLRNDKAVEWVKSLGFKNSDILLASKVLSPYKKKTSSILRSRTKITYDDISKLSGFHTLKNTPYYKFWKPVQTVPTNPVNVYLPITRGNNKKYDIKNIVTLATTIRNILPKPTIIYGIKIQAEPKFQRNKNWVYLPDYIQHYFDTLYKNDKYLEWRGLSDLLKNSIPDILFTVYKKGKWTKNSRFDHICTKYLRLKELDKKFSIIEASRTRLLDMFGDRIKSVPNVERKDQYYSLEHINQKYPMLYFITPGNYKFGYRQYLKQHAKKQVSLIVDYINQIDRS